MTHKISTRRRQFTGGLAASFSLGLALPLRAAFAQDASSKPIHIVVPFAPGGSNDIVGRTVAQQLSTRLKRSVIVENRGGGGGVIGTERVARADPDGTTLLLISSTFTMKPSVMKLEYDPIKSFTPIAMLGMGPSVIAVPSALPVNSIKELIDYSRTHAGKVNFGSAGVASFQHFAIELFKMHTGADLTVVQYKGGGPALIDLASGNVQVALGSLIQMQTFLQSGKIKLLAVAGPKRVGLIPDVPTLKESGIDVEVNNWWGLLAPAGAPDGLVEQLHRETNIVLADPEMNKRFAAEGAETLPMTRAEFAKFISDESKKWADVAKKTGLQQSLKK